MPAMSQPPTSPDPAPASGSVPEPRPLSALPALAALQASPASVDGVPPAVPALETAVAGATGAAQTAKGNEATWAAEAPLAATTARPGLWRTLWRGLCGLGRVLAWAWRLLLGIVVALVGRWTAPAWLRWGAAGTRRWAGAGGARVRARPMASLGLLLLAGAVAASSWWGWRWWQAQPRPVETSLSARAPGITDFANNGAPKPLVLDFSQSAAPLAAVGKELPEGLLLTPALAGTWRWVGDKRIEFTPKAEWLVGTPYRVTLNKAQLAPQVRMQSLEAEFTTPAFVVKLRQAQFHQDPVTPATKQVAAQFEFSHPVNSAEFEKRLEMRLAEQAQGVLGLGREKTPFTVSYDKLKLVAYVNSAVLPIPKEATALRLALDKGAMAALPGVPSKEGLTAEVQVPGLYSLQVANALPTVVTNARGDPDQVLVLETTQVVHEREAGRHVLAWVLPLQNPAVKKEDQTDQPHAWGDLGEVTAEVLRQAGKLDLKPVPSAQEHTTAHSYRMKADVGRYVLVQLDARATSFGGYRMRENWVAIVQVPPFPSELRILSQGALLPMSGEKKVAVLVRDLPGLRVELSRLLPSQIQHLVSQTQGSFANPEFLGRFGADNISERFERLVPLPTLQRGKAHHESIDLAEHLSAKGGEIKRGLFLLKVQGYDPVAEAKANAKNNKIDPNAPVPPQVDTEAGQAGNEPEAEGQEAPQTDPSTIEDRRLVLVTDLGLLVKQWADGSREVFVQSIFTGEPVAGVSVQVIAKNGSALLTQTTDATGRAHFERLEGMERERAPLYILARKDADLSFMPLARGDRALDYSRFDVGGVQNARSQEQLNAYLFSDRGIYRPGETLRIGLVVKAADWSRSLAGVPLQAEVLDPRGLVVHRAPLRLDASGFGEISHTTQDSSPTGNYAINLNLLREAKPGDPQSMEALRQLGSTSVKVQEFLPDRMKVTAQMVDAQGKAVVANGEGWVSPKDLKARVLAQNLFGTPAENRRTEWALTLSPAYPSFRAHPGYSFYDPQRAKESFNDSLPEAATNPQGEAEHSLNLARFAKATYRLELLAKVFEPEGGRHVAADASVLVSDQAFLVGVKHDGDLGFVSRGSKRVSHLIAIGPDAARVPAAALSLQHVERKVVSVLMRQESGLYRYESRKKDVLISEQALALPQAGHALVLDTQNAGNYSYVVRDAAGQELNRVDYSVAGQGNITRSLERNAELQLTLDKKSYAAGQSIQVSIRAPYVGAGLITVERDRVYVHKWFKTTTTASVQSITLPKDFEGNGYVNVQFIRNPDSEEVFMSPLSYGVAPFATELGARANALQLSAPALVKPGQALKIKLTAAKPTRAVVFAVDEGILQVARYSAADPLGHFFQKRALEVRSSQILDLILPEFKRLMAAAAPGGDEAGANAKFLNPFKRRGEAPAVYWSGIVDVQGEREFSYTVPDHFNGRLRVMAVAVSEGAMGVALAATVVRGDFVLSPNLPLAVAPGDSFEISVGVAHNVEGANPDLPVQVTLKAPPALDVVGSPTQSVKIASMREGVVSYKLKVKNARTATLGSALLEITTSQGGRSATRKVDLAVRPATPRINSMALGSFLGSHEVATPRDLVPEHHRQDVALSVLPLALAPGLMSYLDHFEHACTEQLVSRALPALILAKRPEFSADRRPQQAAQTLEATLRTLRTRQNAQGGFGLWQASVQADEFASVYAVHLMAEARELELTGATVPNDLWNKSVEYLQQLAASNPSDLPAARARAYAIYLLTRGGAVTTPLLTTLRETLDAKHPKVWTQDAAAAFMAATYSLLKQERAAAELLPPLIKQLEQGGGEQRYQAYADPTIRDAQVLYVMARHFPAALRRLEPSTLARVVAPLAEGRYNTLSAAWVILALDGMARTLGGQALGKLSAVQVNAAGKATALVLPANLLPRVAFEIGTTKLQLANENRELRTWYSVVQNGFDREPPRTELKQGLEVLREYVGADGKPLASVKLGEEITVKLSLRGLPLSGPNSPAHTPSVALVDLLPGGFEVVQQRGTNNPAAPSGTAGATNAPATVGGAALEHAQAREDRVVIYARATDSVQTWTYRMRATNLGEFVVPPAFAQALYERERQARSLPGKIVVQAK